MLEEFFFVPTAEQRLRFCILGAHLDEFCSFRVDGGYVVLTSPRVHELLGASPWTLPPWRRTPNLPGEPMIIPRSMCARTKDPPCTKGPQPATRDNPEVGIMKRILS